MTQITIRRLDASTIERLKRRAAEAGHSMEEEIRHILSHAVDEERLHRQRAWLKDMAKVRRRIFGGKVAPDSSGQFRRMREARSRQIEQWALPSRKAKR